MKMIGLDVGDRRIGIAISDPNGRVAVPSRILERRNQEEDIDALAALAREEGSEGLVVGLPLSLDGSMGPQAKKVDGFARRVASRLRLPLEMWDERFTTAEVERALAGRGKGRPSDDIVAAVILQAYLDSRRARPGEE